MILLSIRPDDFVLNFRINVKNPKSGDFSNRLYYQQLEYNNNINIPNQKLEKQIREQNPKFFKNKFFNQKEENKETFKDYFSSEKIPDSFLASISLITKLRQIPIVFSDLPEIKLRHFVLNLLTVCQLREIFKQSTQEQIMNPDITPQTSLNFASLLYPEIFLQKSDEYTVSLIEYILHKKKPKNLLIFAGIGQAESLQQYILNRKIIPLKDSMIVPEPQPLLFKKSVQNQ